MRKFILGGLIATLGSVLFTAPSQAKIQIEILKPIVVAKVDRTSQRMQVLVNGKKVHSWKVSTGAKSYETPRGTFKPYRMHKMWHSRKYNMAPMPHAVFYKGGYAVHATYATGKLGRPASHGCVRLSPTNAKKFYNLVRKYGRNRTEISVKGAFSWAAYRKKRRKYASKRRTRKTRSRSRYASRVSPRRYRQYRRNRYVYRGGYAYTSGYGYAPRRRYRRY